MKRPPQFVDSTAIRKSIKKANLADAKTHFPHAVKLEQLACSAADAKTWLLEHRFRSWKQHGLRGDYYVDNWRVIHFANPSDAIRFKLANFKR